jgi:hypothetical protein
MNSFYQGMEERGYKVGEVLKGQQLNFLCFWVHMSSAAAGILGLKRPFGVTPKGVGGRASWGSLWLPILMMVLSAAAFVWGIYKYVSGQDRNTAAIVINSVWALYHAFLLSGMFRLNRPLQAQRSNERTFAATGSRSTGGADGLSAAPASAASTYSSTGAPVFATANADGTITAPPRQRNRVATGRGGRAALGLMALSLLVLGAAGWTMGKWYLAPTIPANVYVLDRTTGRDYQEHRGLTWTLNFLKVKKQPNFGPDPSAGRTTYDFAHDYYGFVPGDPSQAQPDDTRQGDLLVGGQSIELPETLGKGVLMLADTYGEFVEYDYRKEKYVRYRSPARGISPSEVDRIEDFANRGNLLIGEWNTLGYPTLPSQYQEQAPLENGLLQARRGLIFFQQQLANRQRELDKFGATSPNRAILEQNVQESLKAVADTKQGIAKLELALRENEPLLDQVAAQKRLEQALHTDYLGFYGRYVDKFEDEEEFDFRLWKNVSDYIKRTPALAAKYPKGPNGPGFVLYPDGRRTITNPQTGREEENPFAEPIILTQEDLRAGVNSSELATINVNPAFKDSDPLLAGVAPVTPMRYWFDVVSPIDAAAPTSATETTDAGAGETRVLTFYKLLLNDKGLEKLRAARFPAKYLKTDGRGNAQVIFPASIAHRQNDALRSFYFAGDASDYTLISRMQELVPATGGITYFLGHNTGPFPMQYYWNYYQPLMRNIFGTLPASVRY